MSRLDERQVWVSLAAACLVWVAGSAHGADAKAGEQTYAPCAACHGKQGEGNEAMNAPKIAGQEGWYLRRQMGAFKEGLRGTKPQDVYGMQMRPMAMVVTDPTALENLVAYIESLPEAASEATVQGDADAGKAAYALCASCHGQQGEGLEQMGGPRLAGQNDWYLARQIRNYRQGLRGYDPKDIFGRQMQPMASTLPSDKAINDVVAYIHSLR